MTHLYVWHDVSNGDKQSFTTHSYEGWLFHMCAMTPSYVRYDSSMYVPWLIYKWTEQSSHGVCFQSRVRQDSLIRGTWLVYTFDTTHSHVWHNIIDGDTQSFIIHPCERAGLFHRCTMTPSYLWQCDTTHPHVHHDSFISGTWLVHNVPNFDKQNSQRAFQSHAK